MLANLLIQIFRANIKAQYYHRFTFIFEFISIVLSLTIYHFTSKAFEPAVALQVSKYQVSYFNYIVIGDLFLAIPLYFLEAPFRNLRIATIEGTWQTLTSLPIGKFKILSVISFMDLPRTLLRSLITFIAAVMIFNLKVKASWLLLALVLQVAAIPFCFGLGIFVASFYILTGKGQSLVGYLSSLSAFFAGSLFPMEVFPTIVKKYSLILSPFSLLLESTRRVLYTGDLKIGVIAAILIWGSLLWVATIFFNYALEKRKNSGEQYLLI